MTPNQIAAELLKAMNRPNPVLFAGAGVGKRVGLPDWNEYIEGLAQHCDTHNDVASGQLIRARAARGQLLSAATVFKTCETIPVGERWKALAAPFVQPLQKDVVERLCPLVSLGFTAIITTNYDTSIHSALAQAGKGWVLPIELDDDSLTGASLSTAFFLARIHGRAQRPQSMIVDTADYANLLRNQLYLDFLLDILRTRSCIFVGFSFLDPAIDQILTVYRDKAGPVFQRLHTAFVPTGANSLISRLGAVNIATIEYDPVDKHSELWRAIRLAFDNRDAESRSRSAVVTPQLAIPAMHQFMAFAYAQMQSAQSRQPIAALVQDGIVSSLLPSVGTGMRKEALVERVRQILTVSQEETAVVVDGSLQRLIAKGQVYAISADCFLRRGQPDSVLETHLRLLVDHIGDRARVRSGVTIDSADAQVVRNTLEAIFVWRAWDVAAHFAGSGTRLGTDLAVAVSRVLDDCARGSLKKGVAAAIVDAIVSLLTTPEDREAPMLAEIGRAAFGLQLVLATPRQVLFRRHALPEIIYLDTNVLMPAITDGHPLQPVYHEAIEKLVDAARRGGTATQIVVGRQFLNEIVSHRRLALQIADELSLNQTRRLAQHVRFYTGGQSNVFIGGFAGSVEAKERGYSFPQYLDKFAPFENEDELSDYLKRRGISTVEMKFTERDSGLFGETFGRLLTGYETDDRFERKEKVLIEHEASQLTQLRADLKIGKRPLFVTSDAHLRRVIQRDDDLKQLAAAVVSHVGLVALVDVMVGLSADTRSLTRLMWATQHVTEERAIFDYFVSLALRNYREGTALEMQEAARKIANEVRIAADAEHLHLFGRRSKDIASAAKLLDRYENRFFEYWRQAIERRERNSEP